MYLPSENENTPMRRSPCESDSPLGSMGLRLRRSAVSEVRTVEEDRVREAYVGAPPRTRICLPLRRSHRYDAGDMRLKQLDRKTWT